MNATLPHGDRSPDGRLSHADVVAWAASMVERLGERAAEAEELRELPQATMEDAASSGVFEMLVPSERGGHGLGLRSLGEMTRILAHGCVSSAWTLLFLVLHNWFVARGPRELQAAVWGDRPYVLMPGTLTPTGTATPVDGGYELTGRWQWATGVQHADWVMLNGLIRRDEGPEARFFLLPIAEVDVVDVWHTSGMRGTGSNDVVADRVFVPADQTLAAIELAGNSPPGAELSADPFVRYPMVPVLTLVAAAAALGGAEAAVENFRERLSSRVLAYSMGDRQATQPASQVRLSQAQATVRAARLVWDDAVDQVCDVYDGGGVFETVDRGRVRLAAAQTVRLSIDAVSTVLEGSGASVHFADSPLQRISRDLLTLRGHMVFDWDRTAELAGKLELGLDPAPTDLL
ncbi:acyl-CoA dehydrogenase family protein [Candidatus Poriferisodalis sp.]|uniref:acyl-CoA dehydrogenase family protein n=1 Tax=Candidatus Poriferisodalis sp. TaxID=3101277 RepID=UPI003C702045